MKTVTAAVLIRDHRLLIAKRRAGSHQALQWELPGGKMEEGETPEECLQREMFEEFQIHVCVGAFLWESIYHYSHGSIRLLAYETFWESGGTLHAVAHEDFRWAAWDELKDYDFSPADVPFIERLIENEMKL